MYNKRWNWEPLLIVILVFAMLSVSLKTKEGGKNMEEYIADSQGNSWTLHWEENFDSAEKVREYWNFQIGNGHLYGNPGWGNAERQYYTDKNWFIEDRKLVIEARKETVSDRWGTYYYTSTRMTTQRTLSIVPPAKIEVRAKLPKGKGIWPAIWMLGENISTVGWPKCGEIDIMEMLGHDTKTVHGTVHGPGYSGGKGISKPFRILDENIKDFHEDYHIFGIEWEPDEIRFFVDGQIYHIVTKDFVQKRYYADWVFNAPFFLILNVAVGGNWPGYPDDMTVFPQRMYIDYIRIYKKTNTNS